MDTKRMTFAENWEKLQKCIKRQCELKEENARLYEAYKNEYRRLRQERKEEALIQPVELCQELDKSTLNRLLKSINRNEELQKDFALFRKLYKHNAKSLLFSESLPYVQEVLKKYEGKPYGKKTAEKINAEIEELTGCHFGIIENRKYKLNLEKYGDYYLGYEYSIEFCPKYEEELQGWRPLLNENKIQVIPDELLISYDEDLTYIDDVKARFYELKEKHAEAVRKYEECRKAAEEFNRLVVGDINRIYIENKNFELK